MSVSDYDSRDLLEGSRRTSLAEREGGGPYGDPPGPWVLPGVSLEAVPPPRFLGLSWGRGPGRLQPVVIVGAGAPGDYSWWSLSGPGPRATTAGPGVLPGGGRDYNGYPFTTFLGIC